MSFSPQRLVALSLAFSLLGCASTREVELEQRIEGYEQELKRLTGLHEGEVKQLEDTLAAARDEIQVQTREATRVRREIGAVRASYQAGQASLDAALARLREREEELARARAQVAANPEGEGAAKLIRDQAKQLQVLRARLAETAAGELEPGPDLSNVIRPSHLDLEVPVAWVDREPLKRRDFVEFLYRDVGAAGFLDLYVNRHLLLREAGRRGLATNDVDVEYWVGQQWIQQASEAGSQERLLATLRQRGFTKDAWEARLRFQARAAIFVRQLIEMDRDGPGQEAWEQRVLGAYHKAFSAQVSARHIFAPLPPRAPQEEVKAAYAHMKRAERALDKGTPFPQVALRYSMDSKSRELGGALGSFDRERFAELPNLNTVFFQLPVGERSKLIRSRIGLHIVLVDERQPPKKSLPEVRAALEERLRGEPPSESEINALIQRLRARAQIKTNLVFDEDE